MFPEVLRTFPAIQARLGRTFPAVEAELGVRATPMFDSEHSRAAAELGVRATRNAAAVS